MARQSEELARRFLQALQNEKNLDVGILEEISSVLTTQNEELAIAQADESLKINQFSDDLIKQTQDMRDGCLKESSEMFSALFTVNKILLDKIKTHVTKVTKGSITIEADSSETPKLDDKPHLAPVVSSDSAKVLTPPQLGQIGIK